MDFMYLYIILCYIFTLCEHSSLNKVINALKSLSPNFNI